MPKLRFITKKQHNEMLGHMTNPAQENFNNNFAVTYRIRQEQFQYQGVEIEMRFQAYVL